MDLNRIQTVFFKDLLFKEFQLISSVIPKPLTGYVICFRFVQLEDCGHVVEVSGMDRWMEQTTDAQENSIQLKGCPHCKTPIRTNLRYGTLIKTMLGDIERVKVIN
jgi:hypothetical protein